jgi:hypothetical protein
MTTNAVTITGSGKIAAVVQGKSYTVEIDHPKYNSILDAVRDRDWDSFVDLVDIASQVSQYVSGGVGIAGGAITYHGDIIHNTLTNRILSFMRDGLPFEPMVKFLNNLMQNPSKRAVDELYDFLEVGELPLTEDGCFLAFKNIRSDWKDIHSGTYDNSVGATCEMPRNRVCEDKDRTCSDGLHFCSIEYLPNFSDGENGKTVIVKINPKDVVSIPADYNNTKGRCCRYEVVSEYKDDWRSKIQRNESGWDAPLYSSDGGEYEDDYDDEDYEDPCEESTWEKPQDKSHEEYGTKPNGHKFHNMRDKAGKFIKKMINW